MSPAAFAQAPAPDWASALARPRPLIDDTFFAASDTWVIQYSEVIIGRTAQGHLRRTYRQILQPLFGEGEEALQLSIPFNQASQLLDGPRVWIPKGRRHELMDLSDSIEVPLLDGSTITAMRSLLVNTPPIAGARRATIIAEWSVEDRVAFPGEDVIFPLDAYPTIELLIRAEGDGDTPLLRLVQPNGAVERVPTQGISLYDIPASQHLLVDEEHPWLASLFSSVPFVHASLHADDGENWSDVADRTRALFDAALAQDTPEPYLAQARALTKHLQSDGERIAALAGFAQSLTYRDIQWGIGAFQPETPSQVLRTRSADCKGKALLLHAMLDAVGIRSTPVLVSVGDRYQDYQAPASPLAFNHVVLAIEAPPGSPLPGRLRSGPGADWVLFDPTDALATYGQPSHRLMQRQGLWLDEQGALFRIEQADVTPPEVVTVDAALTAGGELRFAVELSGPGEYAYDAAMSNASPMRISERLRQGLTEQMRQVLPGLRIEVSRYSPPDHRTHTGAKIQLEGAIPEAVAHLGSGLYSLEAPMLLLAELADLPVDGYADAVRERPVAVPTGWEVDPCCEAQHHHLLTRLRLTLPKRWQVDRLPHFAPVATSWLDANLTSQAAADDTVNWEANLTWSRGRFPSQSASERTALLNRVVAAYQEPILLRQNGADRDTARR
ncbi:MAG: hypothetical protein AAGA68_25420 [Pseudomonadota bacterium]